MATASWAKVFATDCCKISNDSKGYIIVEVRICSICHCHPLLLGDCCCFLNDFLNCCCDCCTVPYATATVNALIVTAFAAHHTTVSPMPLLLLLAFAIAMMGMGCF